jgi:hypothetical protein
MWISIFLKETELKLKEVKYKCNMQVHELLLLVAYLIMKTACWCAYKKLTPNT